MENNGNRLVNGVRGTGTAWVEMWRCRACEKKSFASRTKCFKCGRARPVAPLLVLEKWSTAALFGTGGGRGVGSTGGVMEETHGEGGGAGRAAQVQAERQARDKRNVRGAVQATKGAGPKKTKQGSSGEVLREEGKTWAQVAAAKKNSVGTKPKPAAAPPAAIKGNGGNAAQADEERTNREKDEIEEEVTVPPPYTLPIPRALIEGRIAALQKRIPELEQSGQRSKLRRARARLEEAEAQYKEAGGGNGLRAYFSLVNERKRITRCEKALEQAHKEIEDADEQEILAQAKKKKAYTMAEKCSRELENARSKLAYLSLQNAQEAGQMAHGYGARQAVEALRGVLQQAQRRDAVPHLDALEGVLCYLDPIPYQGEADPIILGLEASDGGSSEWSGGERMSGTSVADESSQEEKNEAKRRRRRLSRNRRWTTAEQRDEQRRAEREGTSSDGSSESDMDTVSEGVVSIVVDLPRKEVKEASAALQQSVEELQYAVEANKQIAEQERMQLQQDIEVSSTHAVAHCTGGHVRAPPATQTFPLNPRLELTASRRGMSTPGRTGEGYALAGVRRRGAHGQTETEECRSTARAGRESSRSRGRRPVR